MSAGLIDHVVERAAMTGHDGRSGALLERAVLEDGRRVVVKTASPSLDLAMIVTDDTDGRERRLWRDGTLDRLPPGVEHCVLDVHRDGDGQIVTVMSDLGSDVPGWGDRLSAADSERVIVALARLHQAFAHAPAAPLMPLERWLTMLSPAVMSRHAAGPNPMARAVVQGWSCLADVVPADVVRKVAAVHADPRRLADRLRSHGVTLTHGDVWPVNLALRETSVVLLDWGLATAAPGVLDMATFVSAAHDATDASPDALVDRYRDATECSADAVANGFMASLCTFGWNTALIAARADGPAQAGARRQLDWWVAQAV